LNAQQTAPDPLQPRIRELFASLDHAGDGGGIAAERVLMGEAGREDLGTRVRFTLHIAAKRVLAARYRAYGCPHTLATCEWLAREIEGRAFAGLAALAAELESPLAWAERLGVPAVKLGRLLVIEDALRAALTQP
jgi:NifU-like protein involved in Fe-S cluster formation